MTSISHAFAPDTSEQLARLRGDFRLGLPVVVTDEKSALFAVSVETVNADRYAAMSALGGRPELVITAQRASMLGITGDAAGSMSLPVPEGATLPWLQALVDPAAATAHALPTPLPVAAFGGLAGDAAIAIAKSQQLLPAALGVRLSGEDVARFARDFPSMAATDVLQASERRVSQLEVSAARLPMAVSNAGRVHVFRADDGSGEHYAIEIGKPDRNAPVLARVHCACFTGDVLGSLKCDCGPQLQAAMSRMAQVGSGLLIYLNQEGRGIGLANKMRAYHLQDRGFDTVEANHMLGFQDDERDFRVGAEIIRQLGFRKIRLLTNNPAKMDMLVAQGIDIVDRVPLSVGHTPQNAAYLATKAAKSGHLLA